MARYIDADKLLEQINSLEQLARKRVYDTPTNSPAYERYATQYQEREKMLAILKAQPTADVVPKSEYDAVVSAVDNSTKEFLKLHDDYQEAKRELEKLKKDRYQVLPDGRVELIPRSDVKALEKEVERLHGILLQFTDIVHKWGTKNNIDTSEISLVPIMNEEADSIIQKANQEVAREIFAEIEKWLVNEYVPYIRGYSNSLSRNLAELKKKYTEGQTDG